MFRPPTRTRRFTPELETGVYRLLQEALTNIARHAGVEHAWVQVQQTPEGLTLRVEDHGQGFDVAATLATGASTGLAGMRERASLLGGTLDITSSPGVGTTLVARLPLRRRSEHDSSSTGAKKAPRYRVAGRDNSDGSAARASGHRRRE